MTDFSCALDARDLRLYAFDQSIELMLSSSLDHAVSVDLSKSAFAV